MPGRVLIVDDLEPNVRLLEAKLVSEYYDVLTALSGADAIATARSHAPDLILLDVMMPEMDGFETCRRLKSDPATTHIPVIMVTALGDKSLRVEGLEAGADDFLTKPVDDLPLFARVRSLIRLKLMLDVWNLREATASGLGLVPESPLLPSVDASAGRVLMVGGPGIDSCDESGWLRDDGHQVTVQANPRDGVAQAATGDPDLVIVSSRLEGDVLRFVSQVRSVPAETVRALPILLVAEAEGDLPLVVRGLDLGANDFIGKPVDRGELLARVRTQIRRRRYHNRLRHHFESSVAMASIDPLTGVYNRRYVDAHLDQLLQHAQATAKPLSLAYCDIDHFKSLNDQFGHDVGDQVLIEFTRRLGRNLRSMDLVARIGGEEFVVLMPDTPADRALQVAERLRMRVAEATFQLRSGQSVPVTVSVGVTTDRPTDRAGQSLRDRADLAMLKAKASGRNRVFYDLLPEQQEMSGTRVSYTAAANLD